jgi:serine/threonine-protein kinase
MPLTQGQNINNRYQIVQLIERGGFGTVYKGWDITLNRPVAIKESYEESAAGQRQFLREAQFLANLSHPNLPRVSDYFTRHEGGQYLVMDFVEGKNLEELRALAGGQLPEAQALGWIAQVLDALSYIHSQEPPVIHRDIKPVNIRIAPADKMHPNGRAVLVDFGIAKAHDPNKHTTSGAWAITPGFSPYEQYRSDGITTDARTDIYALGATLYTLLTGKIPEESVVRLLDDPLVPPRKLNSKLSWQIEMVILKAMQSDPGKRFQSADEIMDALKDLLPTGISKIPVDDGQPAVIVTTLPAPQPPAAAVQPPPQPVKDSPEVAPQPANKPVVVANPPSRLPDIGQVGGTHQEPKGRKPEGKQAPQAAEAPVGREAKAAPLPTPSPAGTPVPPPTPSSAKKKRLTIGALIGLPFVLIVMILIVQAISNASSRAQWDSEQWQATQDMAYWLSQTPPAQEPTLTLEPTVTSTPSPTATYDFTAYVTQEVPSVVVGPVYIPGGTFQMGEETVRALEQCQSLFELYTGAPCEQDWYSNAEPVHTVTLNDFAIDQTEVTNAMFADFLNAYGYQVGGDLNWFNPEIEIYRIHQQDGLWVADAGYENYPVVNVTWYGAEAYCSYVGGALPTEAQWEYAARGGLVGALYPWGDVFGGSANFCDVSCDLDWSNPEIYDGYADTAPVGSYDPNGYGLFDMAGNVEEWVADWYGPYSSEAAENPAGAATGDGRVLRGGSWYYSGDYLRVSHRLFDSPDYSYYDFGFRCAYAP